MAYSEKLMDHYEHPRNVGTLDVKDDNVGTGMVGASSSLVTEWVKGKTLDEAGQLTNAAIAEELALPPVKIHCSILAEDAIKAAINDYRNKQSKE